MKTIISSLLLLMLMSNTSCKKDDNASPSINTAIQEGKWKVTLYNSNGNDETNHYTNYEFQFNSNGTISAFKSGSDVSGTWAIVNDNSQQKLVLSFSTPPFDELNNDWHIIELISNKISLEDVSGGNGGIDLLTFERI